MIHIASFILHATLQNSDFSSEFQSAKALLDSLNCFSMKLLRYAIVFTQYY